MQILILLAVGLVTLQVADPAPSMIRTKKQSRTLECERLTAEAGSRRHPGEIIASRPRGDFVHRRAVVCAERLAKPGLRPARDEAILADLDDRATELAAAAASLRPDLKERTWLVETYYPSAQVSSKLAFATKNALMLQGLSVSDRTPVLGAGDVGVLTRMSPDKAYPAACERYYAIGSLGEDDALLAVVSRDRRETTLHAGLCTRGQWIWLR